MTGTEPAEQSQSRSGSPSPGEPAFLAVGRLRRPHGVRGEIEMDILTDFPERLRPRVWVLVGPEHRRLQIRSTRSANQAMLIAFRGYDSPEAVGEFRNQTVFVRADDIPELEEGEFYHHQLIGLKVYSDEERLLGVVREILETGSNDVLLVRPAAGPDVLIPLIEETILEISPEKGLIRMKILPGLLEE